MGHGGGGLVAKLCDSWDSMDCSLPGSSVFGIHQARILEWVAISFSRGSSWLRDWTWVSYFSGRFFTNWAMKEDPLLLGIISNKSNCDAKIF